MRLATIRMHGEEIGAIVTQEGILPIRALNQYLHTRWEESVFGLIRTGQLQELNEWFMDGGMQRLAQLPGRIDERSAQYAPLYRHPRQIFGIGLNYRDHAKDIGDAPPQGFPGSFLKLEDTIIGHGDEIRLPELPQATRTTAEAELGIIMGRDCRDVPPERWMDAIAGFTTILDMTEESILKGNEFVEGNPRYLTIVKNFPTFFSFGPQMVTPDEIADVEQLQVQSILNGEVFAENIVANMTHKPARLVSLHSSIQGWHAGDVLSTGTPRAFPIVDGDQAECRITGPDGFEMHPLKNPVKGRQKSVTPCKGFIGQMNP